VWRSPSALGDGGSRRPVSRVLSPPRGEGQPFLLDARRRAPLATNPDDGAEMLLVAASPPNRPSLFGLAPGGVYPAAPVARGAVRSCRTVSPLPSSHGCPWQSGGLFSVALSLGSPPPAVSRHRIPVEPGLSSTGDLPPAAAVRPSGWRIACALRAFRSTFEAPRHGLPLPDLLRL
jgi:hypothetical protein